MKTKEEILIGIFGSCRCAPIYKTRGMTDPECVICNEGLDIINAMQTFADQECAAKDAEIAELKRRVAKLDEDQLLFHKWTCRVPTEGRTTEKLWADYQKARPYIVNELKQK